MPRISSLLMALVLAAGAAHASSTTSASVTLYGVAGSITACTQTGPTESSCTEGSQEGSTGYAAADATVTEPGVLSLYAYSVGSVIDPDSPGWLAIASASFSYMIEVTGGVGQVLVVPRRNILLLHWRCPATSAPNIVVLSRPCFWAAAMTIWRHMASRSRSREAPTRMLAPPATTRVGREQQVSTSRCPAWRWWSRAEMPARREL